jgi:hypothetical protein
MPKNPFDDPDRLGVGDSDQWCPFQLSATVARPDGPAPAATHALPEVHEIEFSSLPNSMDGQGVFCIDHRWPFQRWASGSCVGGDADDVDGTVVLPTA